MIRKLGFDDKDKVLDFLCVEAAFNLFLIGDIECYGFENENVVFLGSYDDVGKMNGVLLKFHENFIPYFRDSQFDTQEFRDIIGSDIEKRMISGKESIVSGFKDLLNSPKIKSTYFCELNTDEKLMLSKEKSEDRVKMAQPQDAKRVYDLLDKIDEFRDTDTNSVERIRHNIISGSGRVYYIEDSEGRLLTTAQTTAESSSAAMIVAVATLQEYRGKGLMSECLSRLCRDVLAENKTLCLFYDNQKAGSVYHRLGFETIGRWTIMIENKK
jgi:uncharacterized protein